jgi:hypothetical protein
MCRYANPPNEIRSQVGSREASRWQAPVVSCASVSDSFASLKVNPEIWLPQGEGGIAVSRATDVAKDAVSVVLSVWF